MSLSQTPDNQSGETKPDLPSLTDRIRDSLVSELKGLTRRKVLAGLMLFSMGYFSAYYLRSLRNNTQFKEKVAKALNLLPEDLDPQSLASLTPLSEESLQDPTRKELRLAISQFGEVFAINRNDPEQEKELGDALVTLSVCGFHNKLCTAFTVNSGEDAEDKVTIVTAGHCVDSLRPELEERTWFDPDGLDIAVMPFSGTIHLPGFLENRPLKRAQFDLKEIEGAIAKITLLDNISSQWFDVEAPIHIVDGRIAIVAIGDYDFRGNSGTPLLIGDKVVGITTDSLRVIGDLASYTMIYFDTLANLNGGLAFADSLPPIGDNLYLFGSSQGQADIDQFQCQ